MQDRFSAYRPLLFTIAYNFLGSIVEAEDVVQDVFLKVLEKGDAEIRDLKHYLTKATTNTCIKRYHQLQRQRADYVGPWLPEPIIEREKEWESRLDRSVLLEIGTLQLLESLNPQERAVWLLRELLGWDYEVIAQTLDLQAAHCRQLRRRAQEKIGTPVRTTGPQAEAHIYSFFATLQEALATDQYDRLVQRLTADARLYSDGGGKVAAALKSIHGAQKVAKFLFGLYKLSAGAFEAEAVQINGRPALLLYRNGHLETTISVGLEGEQCAWLAFVRNPEKIPADFVT